MVANLHETKFKTTKNNSVNQKKLLRGNLHVNFQCEGQLKFFDVVGSFFLAHWIFDWHWKKILVSDFSHTLSMCMTLDTLNEQACQNLYHPGCSVGLFNLNILVFFKPPVLSEVLVRIHSLHWETMFGIRQNPIHFFFTFHIDDSGMRKCEVQKRDGWKSTINWLCTPSEKGIKHYLLSWVTSKE